MNWYVTLAAAKDRLGISGTGHDADLQRLIEEVSREIDRECRRHFYVRTATRVFSVLREDRVLVGDLLSVSSAGSDTELDNTFDGETLVEGTDFVLLPDDGWPKWKLWRLPKSTKRFFAGQRTLQVAGEWGYGDGERSDPVDDTGAAGTVGDATSTTVTVDDASGLSAGQTLRLDSEQMFVESIAGTTLTVKRGVNGTTAAAHAGAAVKVYRYPALIEKFVKVFIGVAWNQRDAEGYFQRRIGSYSEMFHRPGEARTARERMVRLYRNSLRLPSEEHLAGV